MVPLRVVLLPPGQVTLKRAVLHGDGTGRVIETAAAAKADATAPVPGDGLVADEGAVGDGDGQPVRGINAAARAGQPPATDRLIAVERAATDREAAGQIENAAAEALATRRCRRGPGSG